MFVVWLFLAVPWVCLQFLIVVFPDHAHLLFLTGNRYMDCAIEFEPPQRGGSKMISQTILAIQIYNFRKKNGRS